MQTFLPVADFKESAKYLDYKRLGKQRVEGMQLLNAMQPDYDKKGWLNHPATVMWTGYQNALKLYVNVMICLLYTSPSPRDMRRSRMPSSA